MWSAPSRSPTPAASRSARPRPQSSCPSRCRWDPGSSDASSTCSASRSTARDPSRRSRGARCTAPRLLRPSGDPLEFIHAAIVQLEGAAVFAGIGERSREGLELWDEVTRRGVLDRTALVFGQMKEPPGARFLIGLAAVTLAEYLRNDLGSSVMLVVDNLYRHVQAGMEVSGLLGRMPSRVGYQPTLAADIASIEERTTSTRSGDMMAAPSAWHRSCRWTTSVSSC